VAAAVKNKAGGQLPRNNDHNDSESNTVSDYESDAIELTKKNKASWFKKDLNRVENFKSITVQESAYSLKGLGTKCIEARKAAGRFADDETTCTGA